MAAARSKRRIFFVVLTWNSVSYIEDCLTSVLGITSFDVRVHVVDNGSTDGTVAVLNAYQEASDGRMDVTRVGVNLGTTVSRNVALRAVGGDVDYICVLDSDTVINDAAMRELAGALEADSGIGLIGPAMSTSSGEEQMTGRNLPTLGIKLRKVAPFGAAAGAGVDLEIPAAPVVDGLQDVPYLLSACWMMPRCTLERVGLLDERIFYAPEDVDYCVRVWGVGLRVVRCDKARIVHEYQRISHKRVLSKVNVEHVKGLAYYFKKYGYLLDAGKVAAGRVRA